MAEQLTALSIMQNAPVIPVIVLHDVDHAVSMAKALVGGGIRVLEVTLRTPQGLPSIEAIAKAVPEAIVGAGTVRSSADAKAAAAAGARFAVSPGFTEKMAQAAQDAKLPLLPGVATSSEVMMAREAGFQYMKFFPAVQAGGIPMLKAWQGPFFDVKFCPTGGVSPSNAAEFLALSNVVCVGGSWLVPADAVAQKEWSRITTLAWDTATLKKHHA